LDEESLRLYQDHLEDLIYERTTELETINNDLKKEIAERQRVEQDLRNAIEKLREHDRAKNMFVSNVSHELRTPLTALIHAIENLIRGVTGPLSEEISSYLSMMLEDCWRLDRTVCDILDLSRIEAGRIELSTANVPFLRMVKRTVEPLRMEAESIPLTLELHADDANGFVECDAPKMERVIMNILNNAIKFTPPGGDIRIVVANQERKGRSGICCQITDNGVGIPEAYIQRVTERFFRVGEQVGGTGLGLAIAKEIIERHDGDLEIISPPRNETRGTSVMLWLPVTEPQQVMIVASDEELFAELVSKLNTQGYLVTIHRTAKDALQNMHDHKHHIVIVEEDLPDMDGSEIIMHMKADPILRKMPVLFLADKLPDGARSSILSNFNIPMFRKSRNLKKVSAAVENVFFSNHVGVQELRASLHDNYDSDSNGQQ
jgi:signal transduction histidine kinase